MEVKSYCSSCTQTGVPQGFQLFCHFRGQSLKITSSIFFITYPKQLYKKRSGFLTKEKTEVISTNQQPETDKYRIPKKSHKTSG